MIEEIRKPQIFSASVIHELATELNPRGFNVPIYQRLYAWTAKEIEKMLQDFHDAYQKDKDYFIGNITLNLNADSLKFDIIDGQQRLTTLWLIGLVFKLQRNPEWLSFLLRDGVSVLQFTARDQDARYLTALSGKDSLEGIYEIDSWDVNPGMLAGIKFVAGYFKQQKQLDIPLFSSFVFNRVKMVAVFLPVTIELNKYFEDMNNRGLQLEPHHIVKADLLTLVSDPFLLRAYASIWDGISQMNRYLEYGLKGELKDTRAILREPKTAFDKYLKHYQIAKPEELTLEILIERALQQQPEAKKSSSKEQPDKVGSVVSFQEFLLHCLNNFLGSDAKSISLDDKQLLNEFRRNLTLLDVHLFFRYLFDCRVLYDQFIIKTMVSGESNRWEIRYIDYSASNELIRKPHFRQVVQIQSMLNVSVAPALWFTQTLDWLYKNEKDEKSFYLFLENLDLRLHQGFKGNRPFAELLHDGTGTARYWFYKLDYILWKQWTRHVQEQPPFAQIDGLSARIRNFQFRDNRSVEHIEPRNPGIEVWEADPDYDTSQENLKKLKDNFGNLALIGVSSNSSYNNQPSINKKQDFIARTNKWGIESLKLVAIYHYNNWTIGNMTDHRQRMIALLDAYQPDAALVLSRNPMWFDEDDD